MGDQDLVMTENGKAATLEGLINEIKGILSECETKVSEIWKERDTDLAEAVSQDKWEQNVDLVKSYDCIRGKKPFVRRFMGSMKVDANSFYGQLKKLGPMVFTKVDKAEIDSLFLDRSKVAREANYQTFFNGYSVDAYGIEDSMGLLSDGENVYYAYLPVMTNHINSSQSDLVGAMEDAKVHFSSRYIPEEFEYFSWYRLTENNQKKYKHEPAYYEEKVNEIRAGYRGKVEEKIAAIVQVYECLKKKYPLSEKLAELLESDVRTVPDTIAFGSCAMSIGEEIVRIPQLRSFPLTGAMWFEEKDLSLLHALYIRLLCSLPVGKVQFTVYDPKGYGRNVNEFNGLFSEPEIFPAKKVLSFKQELEEELKKALEYVRDIRQNVFKECPDWVTYNRKMNKENTKKLLPYKVFTFFDIPEQMGQDTLEMLENLIRHSKECGFLVLFSHREKPEGTTESKWKAVEECMKLSKNLADELSGPDERMHSIKDSAGYSIEFEGETVSDKDEPERLLGRYVAKLKEAKSKKVGFDFNRTIDINHLFENDSRYGLEFTIGYDEKSEEAIKIKIYDQIPHYLIGGTSGSGKSNLIHNLIMSACSRYSPEELQVYLMDFKEGVELSAYARPILPHARLVATEADTEYGVNVLEHLTQEYKRRYQIFKKSECTNITTYRNENPDAVMPRILVVIDEFQELLKGVDKEKTMQNLADLEKQGRASGIHLVMATQNLVGLEFGPLESELKGRIALNCNAENSKRILGGISCNNEEATKLTQPYAIVNTSGGRVSENVIISVPYADPNVIRESIIAMRNKLQGKFWGETVIFEGKTLPKHPAPEDFKSENAEVILGREMCFDAGKFAIKLQAKEAENILGVISDDFIKRSLVKSMALSALGSEAFDEFVYIGTDEEILDWDEEDGMQFFRNASGFLEYVEDELFESKRLVVFDNYNLSREEGAAIGYGAVPTGTAKKITDYIKEASGNGSHCVALYSRITNMKNGAMPQTEFEHRIGYGLNEDDARTLVGNMSFGRNDRTKERCFYAENGSITGWFQPFVMKEEE